MAETLTQARRQGPTSEGATPVKEPRLAQFGSFIDLFIWLIIFKTFFTPIFQIPTGSMAQTLFGEHAVHTCPNCGWDYPVGTERRRTADGGERTDLPPRIQCPNCRWVEESALAKGGALRSIPGDRIIVHAWPYDLGGLFGPQRWDVIVFKNPNSKTPNDLDQNFIKRLIGLPGETIELIDGDVFVQRPGETEMRVARKTPAAQQALWMPFHSQDYLPQSTGPGRDHPRWERLEADGGWDGLKTRRPTFDSVGKPAAIQFLTRNVNESPNCVIEDIYGYNSLYPLREVTDVRLLADVEFDAGDGCIELQISKYQRLYFARLYRDGRVTLECEDRVSGQRAPLGQAARVAAPEPGRMTTFSIGHADYQVVVAVNDVAVITTTPDQVDTRASFARQRNVQFAAPVLRIRAERIRGALTHLRVERDVNYRGDPDWNNVPANVSEGHPLTLRNEYFPMGDNSPASLDGRYWRARDLNPTLTGPYAAGNYTLGTVPADQMIGKAFLVYLPGLMPVSALPGLDKFTILPDAGHVRWIR